MTGVGIVSTLRRVTCLAPGGHRAAASPAWMRSRIRVRSNPASAPKTWMTSLPPWVVASFCSVRHLEWIPRSARIRTTSISSDCQLGFKRTETGHELTTVNLERAEAMGVGSASSFLPDGRCRIPFPDLRPSPSVAPRWRSRCESPSSPRYRARAGKLTMEQEAEIRSLAGSRSRRSLAAV